MINAIYVNWVEEQVLNGSCRCICFFYFNTLPMKIYVDQQFQQQHHHHCHRFHISDDYWLKWLFFYLCSDSFCFILFYFALSNFLSSFHSFHLLGSVSFLGVRNFFLLLYNKKNSDTHNQKHLDLHEVVDKHSPIRRW